MKTSNYDIVVIGSGLGGLVSAVLLAMEGYKVLVLEKNKQFGGNLQTFSRKKKIFDTGVHYIGSLEKGQNLYRCFDYLGIMKDLKIERMPTVFDRIQIGYDTVQYPIAQGYTNFLEELTSCFPDERETIQQYLDDLQRACSFFPLYNLEHKEYVFDPLISLSLSEYFDTLQISERLQSVLLGSNFLYAGEVEKTPFYVHALIVNSYIQSAYRCVNGGGQIAKLLVRQLRLFGGVALRQQEVISYNKGVNGIESVETKDGNRYNAGTFISNVDPLVTLKQIGATHFRKSYYDRVSNCPLTVSSFSLHLVLLPNRIHYDGSNFYFHDDSSSTRSFSSYNQSDWPKMYMLSMTEDRNNPDYADTLTILTSMHFDDTKAWHTTENTKSNQQSRGNSYDDFKEYHVGRLIEKLQKQFPNIKESIAYVDASTPLTYRDYIGTTNGSLYGPQKNAKDSLKTFLPSRTKIPNLFFAGQSVGMHGILGVTLGAVVTCGNIVGQSYLINKIRSHV